MIRSEILPHWPPEDSQEAQAALDADSARFPRLKLHLRVSFHKMW